MKHPTLSLALRASRRAAGVPFAAEGKLVARPLALEKPGPCLQTAEVERSRSGLAVAGPDGAVPVTS